MLYLKSFVDGKPVKVELYGDEIFTQCFRCEKEMQVDEDLLRWILQDGGELCSTSISCGCNSEKPALVRVK